ncbi:hypothetical protein IW140_000198 [Coemansia sp. RSA 1813]|nr:hypothetical protein EV178_000402 [Coemansia sp. RSA 1646]KAJ1773827.1 hypothetical protein LPJ74_000371 [Coemansia sp. RSA 1843]KAJ2093791.1 hypothetical protein IW138_000187 [Coemansia sp. RSA 986]KAJ2218001.1 hypothetical protein EV179_000146 [Coemansia sp. RSA 487]KAJ2573155.1 hypothetical protein IW140_000198 [Coemansia sp. RSA 1813]
MTATANKAPQVKIEGNSSGDTEKKQKANVPEAKKETMATERRQSSRIASKKRDALAVVKVPATNITAADGEKDNNKEVLQFFATKMDMILEGISRLGIDNKGKGNKDHPVIQSDSATSIDNVNASSSYDSDKTITLAPLNEERESDICEQLFKPAETVPKPDDLRKALLNEPAVRIPIHQYVYDKLKDDVAVPELEKYFSIVEQVGNIAPQFTPRIETALLVNNVNVGTESMQQHVMDAFLMGVIGTAQEHLTMDVMIDRNAAEPSMTLPQSRPDYLLIFNGLLVFKGEEKKGGNIRHIALELTEKMISGAVGKKGKLEYLLGYATAGSRVLFECIYEGNQMVECTDIINLTKPSDRVTMLIVLINVVRIAHALYLARRT